MRLRPRPPARISRSRRTDRPANRTQPLPSPRSGPSSVRFWRSPLRGLPLTSLLGLVLLPGIVLLLGTGLLSYAAYNPDLSPVNDTTPDKGWLGFYLFVWPTGPPWLYRVNQGLHVTLGVALIPVLLAKLWSVIPKLFALPPARSFRHALERVSLLLLVGGGLFEFGTGLLNVQLAYLFPGSFYTLHFYGAWVFGAAFVVHVALRLPRAVRAVRKRRAARGDVGEKGGTRPGPPVPGEPASAEEADAGLRSPCPGEPTLSRRGALGMVGGGSLLLLVTTVGQNFDGLRRTALFAPHGGSEPGEGPNGFQINKTAAHVGVTTDLTGSGWRLTLRGSGSELRLSRAMLLDLPQHSVALPIACVEGWSTSDQWWRGVRLLDLAALVGHREEPPDVLVGSVQSGGPFREAALRHNQVGDPRSLLALHVNGVPLSLDHGYPARIIVPAAPGVLNTKWVGRMTFGELS